MLVRATLICPRQSESVECLISHLYLNLKCAMSAFSLCFALGMNTGEAAALIMSGFKPSL